MNDTVLIIKYLTLLELDLKTEISEDIIKIQYRKLAHVYHPDISNDRYKNGNKFKELKEAEEYLLKNISYVNKLIRNNFNSNTSSQTHNNPYEDIYRWTYQQWKWEEEQKAEEARKKAEAKKRAEERKKREEARKKEEAKRRAEEEARVKAEKEKIIEDIKKIRDSFNKDDYSEQNYNKILNWCTHYIKTVNYIENTYEGLLIVKNNFEYTVRQMKKVKTKEFYRIAKKHSIRTGWISLSVITIYLLLSLWIVPTIKYNNGIKELNKLNFDEAEVIFQELDGFKDSEEKIVEMRILINLEETIRTSQKIPSNSSYYIEKIKSLNYEIVYKYNYFNGEEEYYNESINEEIVKKGYLYHSWYLNSEVDVENKKFTIIATPDKYEKIQFEIEYNLNGGVATNSLYYNVETGSFILNNPTKEGYIFIGWTNDDITTPQLEVIIERGTHGDLYFAANYTANKYKVTLDSNGGTVSTNSLTATYDSYLTLPTPTRTGYTFKGWYNGTTKVVSGTWNYIEDLNLTAKWEASDYVISYNVNGGFIENHPKTYKITDETFIIPNPTKEGYTFVGWTSNKSDEIVKDLKIETGTYGEIILTANYTVNKYNVTLDVNGGDILDINSFYVNYDSEFTLPIPSKIGYTFKGWYSGTTKVVSGTWNYINDVNLIAKWEIVKYVISYNLKDGSINNNTSNYYVTDLPINIPNPTKEGYTFVGWSSNKSDEIVKDLKIETGTYGDIILTANYTSNYTSNIYTVTLDVNGGEQLDVMEFEVVYGEEITLETPIRTGYIFNGWYYEDEEFDSDVWNIDSNVTLIAKWNEPYTENGITYINLGKYPQTVVTDSSLITSLKSISTTNSLGYIEYNGEEYKKVTASPYGSSYTFINGTTITSGNTYYFKVEPIKWRVLTSSNGTYKLLSEMILDNTYFYSSTSSRTINGKTIYPNNYEYSSIRAWLNGYNGSSYNVSDYTNKGFIDIAFTEEERKLINSTLVDNSADTTGNSTNSYVCNNTTDKIYLLSYKDLQNINYGFEYADYNNSSNTILAFVSDYARSKGCFININNSYYGAGFWWLRSAYYYDIISGGNSSGYITKDYISNSENGIRAALEITI